MKDKIFTHQELNKKLLQYTKNITYELKNDYNKINIIGEIIEPKVWKKSGMSFKILHENTMFECKLWLRNNKVSIDDILDNIGNCCVVTGNLSAEYYYSHKFVLNVTGIQLQHSESRLKILKNKLTKLKLNKNKKNINWDTIKNIGLISKRNTQGYNDFTRQLTIPMNITLFEIPLEGKNTANCCVQGIDSLMKTNDLIIIVRGGGSTSEISNSFDELNLFKKIRESTIPIITAIGHESDKNDKLLITTISDLDYATPSTASYEINKIFINKLRNKMETFIDDLKKKLELEIEKKNYTIFKQIENLLFDKTHKKYTIIKSENKNNLVYYDNKTQKFYKIKVDTSKEVKIDKKFYDNIDKLEEYINNYDFDNISKIVPDNKKGFDELKQKIKHNYKIIKNMSLSKNYKNLYLNLNIKKKKKIYLIKQFNYYNDLLKKEKQHISDIVNYLFNFFKF